MEIFENVHLKEHTTFNIGGPARYFCVVKSEDELKAAVAYASVKGVPIFILGGGSNVLVSDKGFPGLVAKMEISGIEFHDRGEGVFDVTAAAGENWDHFVEVTVNRGLYGLENLSGIPGTVGAAPVQNIGAYGSEVKDTLQAVHTIDRVSGKTYTFLSNECHFGYRDSIFKKKEGTNVVITSVTFRLRKHGEPQLSYKDVAEYFKLRNVKRPSLKRVREAIIEIRSKKFPDLERVGTAGSFFKNPIIDESKFQELKTKFPELPSFPASDGKVKLPLAWILDKVCGFRGARTNDAGVWQNQALVLVNYGSASAQEIGKLAEEIMKKVEEKTGIVIEPEVQWMG